MNMNLFLFEGPTFIICLRIDAVFTPLQKSGPEYFQIYTFALNDF